MSQNLRNQPSEHQGNSGRSAENWKGSRYYGFEGMNYEQRRPSYSPQQVSNNDKEDINSGGSEKRRDEL